MVTTTRRKYKLGDVKPWVADAADFLGNLFGFTDIGGWRAHGSVANSDHPKGLALDFMTNDSVKGNQLLQYGISHAKELGIHYLIYNRKIYEAKNDFQPRTYTGPSPHTDHVHISFNAAPGSGVTDGATPAVGVGWNPSSWPVIGQIEGAAEKLTSPDWWKRLGLYVLGTLLVVFGLIFLFREPIEQGVATAAKIETGGVA
jgi:hypothetical protein